MKLADHPNAQWLSAMYLGAAAIKHDSGLTAEQREQRFADHVQHMTSRFSPDFTIHTGGRRLAAVGDLEFMRTYSARRTLLSGGTFRAVELFEVVADDTYGCITGRFEASTTSSTLDTIGMGVWRFSEGLATEHWELADSQAFDRFFLAADPTFEDGTAEEFWLRPMPDA